MAHLPDVPFYNADLQVIPPAVQQLNEAVGWAEALLLACPEDNYSLAPVLKNALDWASRAPENRLLAGKPVVFSNAFLRKLLINSAQFILGPFGEDCNLQRFGLRLASRGGKNAKRKAVVAVGRKLAVLLHRLWKYGEIYNPLYKPRPLPTPKAA